MSPPSTSQFSGAYILTILAEYQPEAVGQILSDNVWSSPRLFNIAVDYWLTNTIICCPLWVSTTDSQISVMQTMWISLGCSWTPLPTLWKFLEKKRPPLVFYINWSKTIFVRFSASTTVNVDTASDFIYHGCTISDLSRKFTGECSSLKETLRRLHPALRTFGRWSRVQRNGKIGIWTKLLILNTCVLSLLLHRSDTWTLSSQVHVQVSTPRFYFKCA